MAARVVFHVSPRNGYGWVVKRDDGQKPSMHDRRDEAIARAKDHVLEARIGRVVVHDQHGQVVKELVYGEDRGQPTTWFAFTPDGVEVREAAK